MNFTLLMWHAYHNWSKRRERRVYLGGIPRKELIIYPCAFEKKSCWEVTRWFDMDY